ncbi:hypothetical protein [Algoriphagus taiwanensis]|uniref:Uncharacterized protein n=1 Tax=Algoriphagus taiwanensis TaxID=1445656 RepID=A0ABQ6PVI5_9BACT|nr:hypothetical protein Ataiwa_02210 [Algoriphagus taiwanensis]
MDKNKLEKLLLFIAEIAELPENEWFKSKLLLRLGSSSKDLGNSSLDEIYEFCIEMIIKDQAARFYEGFKISSIKENLIQDFIRMERFKRKDDFEDFCLAGFQQVEGIVNHLVSSPIFQGRFNSLKSSPSILKFDKITRQFTRSGNQTVASLIFMTNDQNKIIEHCGKQPVDWFFKYRLRAVLYFFYFNEELKFSTNEFDSIYSTGNQLYLIRNSNHRGGNSTDYQEREKEEILSNFDRYYFKFLGFLEDFIFKVNSNLEKV